MIVLSTAGGVLLRDDLVLAVGVGMILPLIFLILIIKTEDDQLSNENPLY